MSSRAAGTPSDPRPKRSRPSSRTLRSPTLRRRRQRHRRPRDRHFAASAVASGDEVVMTANAGMYATNACLRDRRDTRVRRRRSRHAADLRSRRAAALVRAGPCGRRDASVRQRRRHRRICGAMPAGRCRSLEDGAQAHGAALDGTDPSGHSGTPPHSASIRRRTSARSATRARSSASDGPVERASPGAAAVRMGERATWRR